MLEPIGFLVGLIVGIILGLLGSGGSLLVVPFFYIFKMKTDLATAYITILVGFTAAIGLYPRLKQKLVDWPTALALGIPVSVGMLIVRGWLNGMIPSRLFELGDFTVTKRNLVLYIIAMLLLLSFATMIGLIGKNIAPKKDLRQKRPFVYYATLTFCGLLIGILPGFSGAGGGVLIVPLLVIFFGLEMKTVVGTALAIVTTKSFVGFFGGDMMRVGDQIDFKFLLSFAAVMTVGALIGSTISQKVDGQKLKTGFAWFLLALAIFIVCYQ